ncbi:MAG: chemotaxis protein CheW [Thermodesulfobacteriota bacterium]|nr:chemotaxis protein CheW [Thermodesulfobacteriota bacterium]
MAAVKENEVVLDDYDEDDEDTQKDKFLTFQVGNEEFGISIRHVTEIIGLQKITDVPDMPDFIKGVINLRGKVIPVMDVRSRFKLESREYDDRTCIVVVNIKDKSVGLVVDRVSEVADIPESQIEPPAQIGSGTASRYIQGMGKIGEEVKILLDVDRLLYEDELESISQAAQ